MEKNCIKLLKLLEDAEKTNKGYKDTYKKEYLKDAINGLMSLDTIAGLRSRESMRREIESGFKNNFEVKMEDKTEERLPIRDSIKDITLFSMAESQNYEGRFRTVKFNKPAFPDLDMRKQNERERGIKDSRKDIHYFSFSNEEESFFQSQNLAFGAQSEKPYRKSRFQKSRPNRMLSSGENIVGSRYGKDHYNPNRRKAPGVTDREEIYRKMAEKIRQNEKPNSLMQRVDLVYEQILGKDLKF